MNVSMAPDEVEYLLEVLEKELEEADELLTAHTSDRFLDSPEKLLQVTDTHTRKYNALRALKARLEVECNGVPGQER